jgi:hypothetical protein
MVDRYTDTIITAAQVMQEAANELAVPDYLKYVSDLRDEIKNLQKLYDKVHFQLKRAQPKEAMVSGIMQYQTFMKLIKYRHISALTRAMSWMIPGHNYTGCSKSLAARLFVERYGGDDFTDKVEALQEEIDKIERTT